MKTPRRPILPALLAALAACGPSKPPPPSSACVAACAHLAQLGCVEAQPTPQGAPCPVWCTASAAQATGVDPGCMARATCETVEKCGK